MYFSHAASIWGLGLYLAGVWGKGCIWLTYLTCVKRRLVPGGLHKRGTFVWTAPGGPFHDGKAVAAWLMPPCNPNPPASSPLRCCTLDPRPPKHGECHPPGSALEGGQSGTSLRQEPRARAPGDSWQPRNTVLQLCGAENDVGFI